MQINGISIKNQINYLGAYYIKGNFYPQKNKK